MARKLDTEDFKSTLLIILEAEKEAEAIIENAKKRAEEIINKAEKDAEEIMNKEIKIEIHKRIEDLRKDLENRLRKYEKEEQEKVSAFINKISKTIESNKESIINEIIKVVFKHGKIENAKKRAEEIINKAEKDAEEIMNKEIKIAHEKIKMEERRRLAEISLKMKEIILRERETIFNEVLNEVKRRLHEFKKTDRYPSILQELILEGCEAIGGGDLVIKIDSKDKEIDINIEKLKRIIEERMGGKVNISIVFDNISEFGGVIVSTPDGSIVYNNTLDAILERNFDDIRRIITKSILEGERL